MHRCALGAALDARAQKKLVQKRNHNQAWRQAGRKQQAGAPGSVNHCRIFHTTGPCRAAACASSSCSQTQISVTQA